MIKVEEGEVKDLDGGREFSFPAQESGTVHSWEFVANCQNFDESFAETFATDGSHDKEYVGQCGIWYMDGCINLWLNDPMNVDNQVIYAIFYGGEANKPALEIVNPAKIKLIDLTQLKDGDNVLETDNFKLVLELSDLVYDDEMIDEKKKIKSFSAKLSLSEKVL